MKCFYCTVDLPRDNKYISISFNNVKIKTTNFCCIDHLLRFLKDSTKLLQDFYIDYWANEYTGAASSICLQAHTEEISMNNYEIISIQQLQAMLAQSKGAKIVTLTTIVIPGLKKDCPYKDVVKISRINVIVNFEYVNSVNRQREKEGKNPDFKPEKRLWGTRLDGLPFVSHVAKDGQHKLYLETKVERVFETTYKDGEGKILNKEIKPYLKEKKSSKEHQGVEKEIILRDYDINNIVTIDIDGHGYILRRNNG